MSPNPEERQGYLEELAASLEQGRRLIQGKGQFPILMRAEGVNAHVLLMEDRVRIQQKEERTFPDQVAKGVRDIPIARISMVRMKKPANFVIGYIQFVLIGGSPGQERDLAKDENTVSFRGTNEPEFERLKAAIEAKISGKGAVFTPPSRGAPAYIEELEQLAALRDRGIITEEEFAAKKRQILRL